MTIRFRHANSITGKALRSLASAPLLMLALGTAATLHAQSGDQSGEQPQASAYSLLYSFQCPLDDPDGSYPYAGVVRDSSGNLYGTTNGGGQYSYGTVFKLTPDGTESVLYSFAGPSDPMDARFPTTSLTLDAAGNLYGTTEGGGDADGGTVYKVTPTGTESVLHSFPYLNGEPLGGVVRDGAGNLYGTTSLGGSYHEGTVFKLLPSGFRGVLHSFGSSPADGTYPGGNLTRDSSGKLFGTTGSGGSSSAGTVFEVAANVIYSVLYSFTGGSADGADPCCGGLLLDTLGNLYGTTTSGGTYGYGVVFKLTPEGTESVLLNFNGTTGGTRPQGGLARDRAGNLYGLANGGGSGTGCIENGESVPCGVLFELTTAGEEIVLHNFTGSSPSEGWAPLGSVLRDASGNLYGALLFGGAYGCGAIFKYTP